MPIHIGSISKTYYATRALIDVNLQIEDGEFVALIGPSGSGKSTLLKLINGLEVSDAGPDARVSVDSDFIQTNGKLDSQVRERRARIAFISQQFNLLNRLSVMSNVLIGLLGRIPRWRGTLALFTLEEKKMALAQLDKVGLKSTAFRRASALSGGQQQRVAIARGLMQDANVLLADEPIASLDMKAATDVMDSLKRINQSEGITTIVTLHQVSYARRYAQRIVALKAGEVVYDGATESLSNTIIETLYGTAPDEDAVDDQPLIQTDWSPASASKREPDLQVAAA